MIWIALSILAVAGAVLIVGVAIVEKLVRCAKAQERIANNLKRTYEEDDSS